ncbi:MULTISPECIES: DUF2945 domain-containing protein [Trichocoleus]|uniref:DUF2945 domain-containing protein n=1 Tax=Trichocoleus desertorum GB2-A4 TaxID=2933944 RepID=A0ABV0JCV8_9CYAN|nr:DUF2945 domain-containing protein [Trichocoleus sp. FACHB-46]MBD1864243.1 DUF2945 domain-containing protein [Trichocoleus sp. FACHB-46]
MALKVGSYVSWKASGGVARGRIKQIVTNDEVPNIAIKITGTNANPAAQVEIYKQSGDGWEPSNLLVAHRLSTLTEIEPLKAPSKSSSKKASMSAAATQVQILQVQLEALRSRLLLERS